MNYKLSSVPSLAIFGFLASFSCCYHTSIPDSMALSNISIRVIEHTDGSGDDGSIFSSLSRNLEQTLDNVQTGVRKTLPLQEQP